MKKLGLIKILSVFLCISVIATVFSLNLAMTASAVTEGIYTFKYVNYGATITACDTSASGDIVIPTTLGGYPVKAIDDYAFRNCENITSMTIPDGVTKIGEGAFFNCPSITSIVIPDSVIEFGIGAFAHCNSLENINIPNGVTSIPKNLFLACRKLENILIPHTVTKIGDGAFGSCSALKEIVLPFGITTIADSTFSGCKAIKKISIPDGVMKIDYAAFYACTGLESIVIPQSVQSVKEIAFDRCSSLTDVYYRGSEEQWFDIVIEENNTNFSNANITFNYKLRENYPDVNIGDWYYDAVKFASQKGYFSGYSDARFGPANNISRQDFILVLARIDGADLSQYEYDCSLRDVGRSSYYESAVNWAYTNGITTGYENGTFGVGDNITREQLVTMLYRYAEKKGYDVSVSSSALSNLNAFEDANGISPFAKDAMVWAIDKGVIKGMNSTKVGPVGKASRAQTAQILKNINDNSVLPF